MKEFTTAVSEAVLEANGTPVEEQFVEFKVDGRVLRAYPPTAGQMTFMMAAMGRGQTDDQRFASIINIMLAALRDSDRDWLEGRLLSRGKDALPMPTIEKIFEHLMEEWFGNPTQGPSDSVPSPPNAGQN